MGGKTLAQEVQEIKAQNPAPEIVSRTWTQPILLKEFRKADGYADFKKSIAIGTSKNLLTAAAGGVDAASVIDMVHDFLIDKVKEKGVEQIVAYALQDASKVKDTAGDHFVRSMGTHFVLLSIALANSVVPVTFPVGVLFTVIIYLHEKEQQEQDAWNVALATKLDSVIVDIRKKKKEQLDAKHTNELERFLLSNAQAELQDATVIGTFKVGKKQYELSIGDLAQLRDAVDSNLSLTPYVTNDDILKACVYSGVTTSSTKTLSLTTKQVELLQFFLKEAKDTRNPKSGDVPSETTGGATGNIPVIPVQGGSGKPA